MKVTDFFKHFSKAPKQIENNDEQKINVHYCCMCGAPETDVNLIIRGADNNYICDKCASMIHYQMTELYKYADNLKAAEQKHNNEELFVTVPTPHEIKEYLDQYVIGQEDAKIKLSVAVYNHYKRIYQQQNDIDIEKSNCIILGNSGCGKTLLAKTIANMLDIPITIVSATSFTQAGYVGEDVESILTRLYQAAGNDIKKAEQGIVFIDEFDKIARKGDNPSITRDVSGEGVQQALLKLIEGAKVKISPNGGRKHPEKEMLEIDTKNILFICSGAFVGIENNIGTRLNMKTIGFSNGPSKKKIDKKDLIKYITSEDIRSYGLIPELVGRLPIVTYVDALDKTSMKKILTEPTNAIIKQYQKLFKMDGTKLTFNDDALDFIVDRAYERKIGARGLRAIVEEIMTQYMYDIPTVQKKKITITKKYAEDMFNKKFEIA